jgi:hypothetical protein
VYTGRVEDTIDALGNTTSLSTTGTSVDICSALAR